MSFYSLQNCSSLAVFDNVRMSLGEQGMVNLKGFKLRQNEEWELELKFPRVLSFWFTTKTC